MLFFDLLLLHGLSKLEKMAQKYGPRKIEIKPENHGNTTFIFMDNDGNVQNMWEQPNDMDNTPQKPTEWEK